MKIAIALGGSDAGRSGIGVYVRSILPHLRASAHQDGNELVAVGTRPELDGVADAMEGIDEVQLDARWDAPATSAAYYLAGGVADAARAAGADVLLLPAANRRTCYRSSLPTVAVVHDLAQVHVRGKYDALRMTYLRHVLLRALPKADVLVAISRATQKDLVAHTAATEGDVRIVPNGVDLERFQPMAAEGDAVTAARGRHGLDRPYLLYLARLEHPGKNHLRLLEAFAQSGLAATTTLALAGADWGAEQLVRDKVAELGIGDSVKRLGFIADADVAPLIAGSRAIVMVGLCEGFGLPALEALAMGIPVIASTTGALPEVAGKLASYCDPHHASSIEMALREAVTDPWVRTRAATEGPRWASSRGWSETARGLYEACGQALATRTARRAA